MSEGDGPCILFNRNEELLYRRNESLRGSNHLLHPPHCHLRIDVTHRDEYLWGQMRIVLPQNLIVYRGACTTDYRGFM